MYTHLSQLFPVKKQWKNLSSYTGTLTIWKEPSSSIFLLLQAKHALLPLPPSHYKVLRCLPSWQVFWTLSSSSALFQTNDSQYCSPNSTGYFPWPQTVNSLSWLLVYPEIPRAWNPTCLPYTTAMEPFLPFAIREVTFCTFILSKPHIMFAGHLSSLLRVFGILILPFGCQSSYLDLGDLPIWLSMPSVCLQITEKKCSTEQRQGTSGHFPRAILRGVPQLSAFVLVTGSRHDGEISGPGHHPL